MEINAKIYVFIFTFNSVIDGNWSPAKFNHVFAVSDRGSRKMDNFGIVF